MNSGLKRLVSVHKQMHKFSTLSEGPVLINSVNLKIIPILPFLKIKIIFSIFS